MHFKLMHRNTRQSGKVLRGRNFAILSVTKLLGAVSRFRRQMRLIIGDCATCKTAQGSTYERTENFSFYQKRYLSVPSIGNFV